MTAKFGAIILSAGLSSRMGEFKLLLPWTDGQPILRHTVSKFTALDIDPIFVITGHQAEQVKATLSDLPVTCIHNPDYVTGEITSSLKVGLQNMPDDVSATFITPADMPLIPEGVISGLQASYQAQNIFAPIYQGQRGHPILLDRAYWADMLALLPAGLPRDVIQANKQNLKLIEVDDEGVVIDLDTPETYQRELKRARQ